MIKHEDDGRPRFACPACGVKFHQLGEAYGHMMRAHGIDPLEPVKAGPKKARTAA